MNYSVVEIQILFVLFVSSTQQTQLQDKPLIFILKQGMHVLQETLAIYRKWLHYRFIFNWGSFNQIPQERLVSAPMPNVILYMGAAQFSIGQTNFSQGTNWKKKRCYGEMIFWRDDILISILSMSPSD